MAIVAVCFVMLGGVGTGAAADHLEANETGTSETAVVGPIEAANRSAATSSLVEAPTTDTPAQDDIATTIPAMPVDDSTRAGLATGPTSQGVAVDLPATVRATIADESTSAVRIGLWPVTRPRREVTAAIEPGQTEIADRYSPQPTARRASKASTAERRVAHPSTAPATGTSSGQNGRSPLGGGEIVIGLQTLAACAAARELVSIPASIRRTVAVAWRMTARRVAPIIPLQYSRWDGSDPLKHETRATVLEAIDDTPGIYLSELSERTGVTLSTLRHHVRILEDEGEVTEVHLHGHRRFYPLDTEHEELVAALNEDATASIVEMLARFDAASVSEIAAVDGRDISTITHHLQNLEADGVVVRHSEGRTTLNRLAPEIRETLGATDLGVEQGESWRPLSAD